MYDRLKNMLEEMSQLDIEGTSNFKATIILRDSLAEVVPKSLANQMVSRINFRLGSQYSDEQISELVEPFCEIVKNIIKAYAHHGFGEDDLVAVCSSMSLDLE